MITIMITVNEIFFALVAITSGIHSVASSESVVYHSSHYHIFPLIVLILMFEPIQNQILSKKSNKISKLTYYKFDID